MTKPCYPKGCEARSQACGLASSVVSNNSDYRWNVNFNNGNTNNINDNNNAWVRLVRGPVAALPREYQGVTVESLHRAYRAARYAKKPSHNQMRFEAFWMDGLRDLQQRIAAGTWTPAPTNCFITTRPKAREIHAPDFADRVVHHWLVPQLEQAFDPGFIHDSFSNREGKGTHAAVTRLEGFVRQVHAGQGGGYFLQLDIKSFFNSIHRPTLWNRLKTRMVSAGVPVEAQRVTHALLRHAPVHQGVVHRSTPAERAAVPPHKRLENANPGCGLPIGNLSSQFFANVYLDALDQFVKHVLKVPRYVRYVDDFVLVHESRGQLAINRRPWTPDCHAELTRRYASQSAAEISAAMNRSERAIYSQAKLLGLRKPVEWIAARARERSQQPGHGGVAKRFQPGQAPHNKGIAPRKGWAPGRMAETQFKKGRSPQEASNYRPIGSLRMSKDGYLEQKVTDDPSVIPQRRWTAVHRLVWIAAFGEVPAGHIVVFKPGLRTVDREDITLDRLECITRIQNMHRNSVHTVMTPEWARVVQLRGALNRKLNRRNAGLQTETPA